jgi:bisphosphoglycerate-dependent phosphoglycerate mutase
MSDSFHHGDSLVSVFSMDRAGAERVKESQQKPLIDFEKEELRERVAALEEQVTSQANDLAKSHKLIKGLHKLVPAELDGSKMNWETVDFDNKDLWAKKLYADLREIDRNWKSDTNLVRAIDKFVANAGVLERPSIIGENLASQRNDLLAELEKTSNGSQSVINTEESFQPQIFANASAAIDLVMNGSLCPDDLEYMKSTFSGFRKLCSEMFKQLQTTASFLEKLIRSLENDEDEGAKKLLAKIRAIQLDLNVSMHNASVMIDDAQTAEQSLSNALERSVRLSMAPNSESVALNERILQLEQNYDAATKRASELTTKLDALRKEYDLAAQKISDSSSNYSKLQKEYSQVTKNNSILNEKLVKMEEESTKASEAVANLNSENEKLRQEFLEAAKKAENLENVVHDKDGVISTMLQSQQKAEKCAQNLVPEILQEMSNIKTCLETVSQESKKLSSKVKPRRQ